MDAVLPRDGAFNAFEEEELLWLDIQRRNAEFADGKPPRIF
jgi:hypothetical protein